MKKDLSLVGPLRLALIFGGYAALAKNVLSQADIQGLILITGSKFRYRRLKYSINLSPINKNSHCYSANLLAQLFVLKRLSFSYPGFFDNNASPSLVQAVAVGAGA